MNSPNYVLKANEGILVPKNRTSKHPLKVFVLIIVGIIIVGSIIFKDNLFSELSVTAKILLVSIVIGICFLGEGSERVPSPFEIWFYDDYLIVYREKHYYNRKVTRKEFDKFLYKDIRKCQYRTITKKINIYGIVEGIWYDYNKDGSLPDKPTYHKTTDSICQFYTTEEPEIDFVQEIEKHCPIKVVITES